MIARYTRPEMGRIWTDENKFRQWLEVELAASEALAEMDVVPPEAARALRAHATFDTARILEIERVVKHDVIAFTTAVAESMQVAGQAESSRWLHYGLTSNDVVDTAQALQIRQACRIITTGLERLEAVLKRRAFEFKDTVQIGRTHGVHAEPITFGLKLAIWYGEAGRNLARVRAAAEDLRVGKISGAVGTFAHIGPEAEERICARLDLKPAPVASQVIQRDRHAALIAALALATALCEKIALEVRHLQRTEVREAEEYFARGQKGSSAMPHKRNPVTCEQICGLARVVRANVQAALEDVALWHERDISHSSVERVILPDSTILADYLLEKTTQSGGSAPGLPRAHAAQPGFDQRAGLLRSIAARSCGRRHAARDGVRDRTGRMPCAPGNRNRTSAQPSRPTRRSARSSTPAKSPKASRWPANCAMWMLFSAVFSTD